MKFCRGFSAAAFGLVFSAAGIAAAAGTPGPGLWVGTVTVDRVVEVHKRPGDMSFDLGVTSYEAKAAESTLVPAKSVWWYNVTEKKPVLWPSTPTTGWSRGVAPLGYTGSTSPPAGGTRVGYGTNANSKNPTTYFRKSFTVSETLFSRINGPGAVAARLQLRAWVDDGIVIYLNGRQVFQSNQRIVPAVQSPIPFIPYAQAEITADPSATPLSFDLDLSSIKKGENELAVEVYAASGADPDLYFDLELKAVTYSLARLSPDLVPEKAENWQYNDLGIPPDQSWHSPGFTGLSAWKTGAAPFGFGKDFPQTPVANKPSVYFRKEVAVDDPSLHKRLSFRLLRDDGAVVYLNGKELFRSNMPTGPVAYETSAAQVIGSSDEGKFAVFDYALQQGDFLPGTNVVAVEIHQHPEDLYSSPSLLTKTHAPFPLRVLFHVDALGKVRLLKEAILVKDSANRSVVLADSAKAAGYSGVAWRGGTMVGLRTSAVGYDFPGSSRECSALSAGEVACSLPLPFDHPNNPFLHRYHPDHDNLDQRFEKVRKESFDITRSLKMTFSDRYPPDPDEQERHQQARPPGWGYSILGGTYRETLSGLHRDDLTVSGWFTLQQISEVQEIRE